MRKKLHKLTTGRRHMTAEQRAQCIRLYKEGYTRLFLAEFYGRHLRIISQLIKKHGAQRQRMPRKIHGQAKPQSIAV